MKQRKAAVHLHLVSNKGLLSLNLACPALPMCSLRCNRRHDHVHWVRSRWLSQGEVIFCLQGCCRRKIPWLLFNRRHFLETNTLLVRYNIKLNKSVFTFEAAPFMRARHTAKHDFDNIEHRQLKSTIQGRDMNNSQEA